MAHSFSGRGRLRDRNRLRCRPETESLEDRKTPSGLTFQFTVDDPTHALAPYPSLLPSLQAAGQILTGLLVGQGTIQVQVTPSTVSSEGAATASPVLVPGGTNAQGQTVLKPAALVEAQTGTDPLGDAPEIAMTVDPHELSQEWFDPSGAARTGAVPAGQHDFESIALHELVHGLGFIYYNSTPGSPLPPPGGSGSLGAALDTFAAQTAFGVGGNPGVLYFTGPQAQAQYGGPVPLYSANSSDPTAASNYSHVGNQPGLPGQDIADLMNPEQFFGIRYPVSNLDLGILADVGWTVLRYPGTPTPPVGPQVLQVQPIVSRGRITEIVLAFNRPMDPASTQDLRQYALATAVRVRHRGLVYSRAVHLSSAMYDANAHTVTLRLGRPLPASQRPQLTVTSVRDIYGHPLNGGSPTPDGVPFVTLISAARRAHTAARR
jgi:hypothetical protein